MCICIYYVAGVFVVFSGEVISIIKIGFKMVFGFLVSRDRNRVLVSFFIRCLEGNINFVVYLEFEGMVGCGV